MSKENPLSHHEQLRYDYLFKNIHYLNEREKKEFAYLQGKLNMASSGDASPEIHHENYDLEESFMEPINQSLLPSYGSRSRAKNIRKVILFQRLSPKNVRFVGGAFCRIACSSSLCRFWHDFYVPKRLFKC